MPCYLKIISDLVDLTQFRYWSMGHVLSMCPLGVLKLTGQGDQYRSWLRWLFASFFGKSLFSYFCVLSMILMRDECPLNRILQMVALSSGYPPWEGYGGNKTISSETNCNKDQSNKSCQNLSLYFSRHPNFFMLGLIWKCPAPRFTRRLEMEFRKDMLCNQNINTHCVQNNHVWMIKYLNHIPFFYYHLDTSI